MSNLQRKMCSDTDSAAMQNTDDVLDSYYARGAVCVQIAQKRGMKTRLDLYKMLIDVYKHLPKGFINLQ